MQRILIIGMCGGGKSTLAIRMGERLGLPVYHLDKLFWKPGWVMTPREDWIPTHERLLENDRWIIDGNYFNTLEVRVPHADTVIHLDFPRRVCLYRIFKRILASHGKVRSDMAPGCPEHLDWEFVKFAWNFPCVHRPQILAALDQFRGSLNLITLTNAREVHAFLDGLPDG